MWGAPAGVRGGAWPPTEEAYQLHCSQDPIMYEHKSCLVLGMEPGIQGAWDRPARGPKSSAWFSWTGRNPSQHKVLPTPTGLPGLPTWRRNYSMT